MRPWTSGEYKKEHLFHRVWKWLGILLNAFMVYMRGDDVRSVVLDVAKWYESLMKGSFLRQALLERLPLTDLKFNFNAFCIEQCLLTF